MLNRFVRLEDGQQLLLRDRTQKVLRDVSGDVFDMIIVIETVVFLESLTSTVQSASLVSAVIITDLGK